MMMMMMMMMMMVDAKTNRGVCEAFVGDCTYLPIPFQVFTNIHPFTNAFKCLPIVIEISR